MPLILRNVCVRPKNAAREIINALHEAKQELAQELEANLKQLKSVLEESQRIAKELEAVLKEVKCDPRPEEEALGGGDAEQDRQGKGKGAARGDQGAGDAASRGAKERPARDSGGEQGISWAEDVGQEERTKQGDGWNPPALRKPERVALKADAVPRTWQVPTRRTGSGGRQPEPWHPPTEAQSGEQPQKH